MRLGAEIFVAETQIAADAVRGGVVGNHIGGVLNVLVGIDRTGLLGEDGVIRQGFVRDGGLGAEAVGKARKKIGLHRRETRGIVRAVSIVGPVDLAAITKEI